MSTLFLSIFGPLAILGSDFDPRSAGGEQPEWIVKDPKAKVEHPEKMYPEWWKDMRAVEKAAMEVEIEVPSWVGEDPDEIERYKRRAKVNLGRKARHEALLEKMREDGAPESAIKRVRLNGPGS